MCGRYANIFQAWTEIWIDGELYQVPESDPVVRYNIAPRAQVPVMVAHGTGLGIRIMQWWLIPHWSKSPDAKYSTFNARSEDAASKPAFRGPFARRRCVVPCSGFYEWKKHDDGSKTPHYITRADGNPLYFAGLWDRWEDGETVLESCVILTTTSNEEMEQIHHRMPCILEPEQCVGWSDPEMHDRDTIRSFLGRSKNGVLMMHQVDRRVGNVRNDSAGLIEPSDGQTPDKGGSLFS
jgi:putative SOS response-associated peptidase YedK